MADERRIWSALLDLTGGNAYGAAGLMGNLYAESALNPKNLQQSFEKKLGMTDDSYTEAVDSGAYDDFAYDGAGYGLAQWTYWSRKEALLAYANRCGVSIGDLDMQLCFLALELRTSYGGVLDALKAAGSVRAASDAVLTGYERPKDQGEAVRVRRAAYGQRYYDQFQKPSPSGGPNARESVQWTDSSEDGSADPWDGGATAPEEVSNPNDHNGGDTVQNYDNYINATGTHYIANSGKDENSAYRGGAAGDQTGHEFELRKWYSRPWTVVLRHPDAAVALLIARLGCAAALNDKIGYDQDQRGTYWTQLKQAGYDPSRITAACEEDCTAGVSANVKAAGALMGIQALEDLPLCSSRNMKQAFVKAGFVALTASKYLTGPECLFPGDILLCENHHAATNVTVGKAVRGEWDKAMDGARDVPEQPPEPVPQGLRRGDYGTAVTAMQEALLAWDPTCLPVYGADGDFGAETGAALTAFQKSEGLPVTGVYDEATRKALAAAKPQDEPVQPAPGTPAKYVQVREINVRSAPGDGYMSLGTVQPGYRLPYAGETHRDADGVPWYLVEYDGQNGWVSSVDGEVIG